MAASFFAMSFKDFVRKNLVAAKQPVPKEEAKEERTDATALEEPLDIELISAVADAQRIRRTRQRAILCKPSAPHRGAVHTTKNLVSDARWGAMQTDELSDYVATNLSMVALGRLKVAGAMSLWGRIADRSLLTRTRAVSGSAQMGWGRCALEVSRRERSTRARAALQRREGATTSARLNTVAQGVDVVTKELCAACREGDVEQVTSILHASTARGLDVNAPDWSATPMVWACSAGHVEIALLLYAHGANHTNALVLASQRGRTAVVHFLFQCGLSQAELDSALLIAAKHGHASTVQYLILMDADPRTRDPTGRTVMRIARLKGHRTLQAGLARLQTAGYDIPDAGPAEDEAAITKRLEDEKKPKISIGF